MKTRGKFLNKQIWFSICSSHREYNKDCHLCNIGNWHKFQVVTFWALRFNEVDSEGNMVLKSAVNIDDLEQMKIKGEIVDYEINDIGLKITKQVDGLDGE